MSICVEFAGYTFQGDFISVVRDILITLGNTVGFLVPVPCPKCGEWSQISEYDGNIIDRNATCPKCGECIFD